MLQSNLLILYITVKIQELTRHKSVGLFLAVSGVLKLSDVIVVTPVKRTPV